MKQKSSFFFAVILCARETPISSYVYLDIRYLEPMSGLFYAETKEKLKVEGKGNFVLIIHSQS